MEGIRKLASLHKLEEETGAEKVLHASIGVSSEIHSAGENYTGDYLALAWDLYH